MVGVLTTDHKGTIAETAIIARAVRLGIDVYRPVNDGLRWDLLFGSEMGFLRVQCKWGRRQGERRRGHDQLGPPDAGWDRTPDI